MDSRWHLEQSCAKVRKTNWKEFHNLPISGSCTTGFSEEQKQRTIRPGPGVPSLSLLSHPRGLGWALPEDFAAAGPTSPDALPRCLMFRIGADSFSPFKTLSGGGDSLSPSGTSAFPVTVPNPDPTHPLLETH